MIGSRNLSKIDITRQLNSPGVASREYLRVCRQKAPDRLLRRTKIDGLEVESGLVVNLAAVTVTVNHFKFAMGIFKTTMNTHEQPRLEKLRRGEILVTAWAWFVETR